MSCGASLAWSCAPYIVMKRVEGIACLGRSTFLDYGGEKWVSIFLQLVDSKVVGWLHGKQACSKGEGQNAWDGVVGKEACHVSIRG